MAKTRLTWVDSVKGFLMILVVIGHYSGPMITDFPLIKYIYWFHMPAFFLLSGLFFKPITDSNDLKPAIHKRFMQLLVPYLFFLLLLAAIKYGIAIGEGSFTASFLRQDLIDMTVGGRFLRGEHGVFWFVTVMFATYLLFLWITRFKRSIQLAILASCYVLAQIEGTFAMTLASEPDVASQQIPMIWNLDVALIAVIYYAIGYYFKSFWMKIPRNAILAAAGVAATAMFADKAGWIDYHLSMKFLRYDHFLLDLVIPIAFTILIVGIFQQLASMATFPWLMKIEKHSISIMYLHILVGFFVKEFLPFNLLTYTLLGLMVPIALSILIPKTIPLGEILLGRFKPRAPMQTHP
ncbi:acyltransferase family protein [Planococcus sp. 1R117A]|uniref:acyltransferase family protein n=1 Tax=Planococcus sp. 1R117A TaxID=3447020 RepID=UPI003EDC2773